MKEERTVLDLTTPIIPFKGTGIFELDADYSDVIARMQAAGIDCDEEVRRPENIGAGALPWTILIIGDDDIELYFAKGRLFRIVLLNNFKGALPNGISLDTSSEDAEKIDPNLKLYDAEDGIYESSEGYLLEDSVVVDKLESISIFIPALQRDDFFEYKW